MIRQDSALVIRVPATEGPVRFAILPRLGRLLLLVMVLAGLSALQGAPRAGGQALNQMTFAAPS